GPDLSESGARQNDTTGRGSRDMTAQEWLNQLLDIMVQKDASDLLISVGAPPTIKMAGKLTPMGEQGLSVQQVNELVNATIPEMTMARFEAEHEANFALSLKS